MRLSTMTVHAVYAKPPGGDPKAGIKPPQVTNPGYVIKAGSIRLYFDRSNKENSKERFEGFGWMTRILKIDRAFTRSMMKRGRIAILAEIQSGRIWAKRRMKGTRDILMGTKESLETAKQRYSDTEDRSSVNWFA